MKSTYKMAMVNRSSVFNTSYFSFCTNDKKPESEFGLYDELKEDDVNDAASATKNLSLKLINTERTHQVLSIFENDYLKAGKKDISAHELCLILHFAVKHMGDMTNDIRINTLLDMLFNRIEGLEFDFLLTTIWSLGVLVAYRGAEIPTESKMKIMEELNKAEIPTGSIANIPSLIFSISCFLYPEEVNEEIYEAVRKLSEHYIKEGITLIDPLQASTMLLGWSRLQYHNQDCLFKLVEAMKRNRFFFDAAEQDLCNILSSISDLHYKDEELIKIIHQEIESRVDEIKPYNLFLIVQSYARIIPEKQQCYLDLLPRLIEILEKEADKLDPLLYVNQWLSLACFRGKGSDGRISKAVKALTNVMTNQNQFNFSDLSGSDASNILVAVSALDVRNTKFVSNLVSIVQHNLKTLTNIDLINLSKSSFYLRQFEDFNPLYQQVHSEAVQRLTRLQPWERKALEDIYSEQDLFEDSPFVKQKMSK